MAQRTIHANLTTEVFPFNFTELSSTVVQTDVLEENRQIAEGFSGQGARRSMGVSQAYFLQNVLPITRGYSSAHFRRKLPAIGDDVITVDSAYVITDALNNVALFSPAGGNNILFDPEDQRWFKEESVEFISDRVTVALLKGITYICYPGVGLFTYDFANKQLVEATVEGITFANVMGVTAAGGTLVLWTENTLYWSSATDPLDFTPSQSTGAGSTQILALKGIIVSCQPLENGFIIYTTKNAVGAQYSGNIAFPWVFAEIGNSVGIQSVHHIGASSASAYHVVWTVSGFMEVTYRGAQLIWPELTESIQRGQVTRSNASGIPSIATIDKFDVKVKSIGSEYITVSIKDPGAAFYETAYVFDMGLSRWGRLDVPHADLLEYSIPQFERQITYEDFGNLYLRYSSIPDDLTYADLGTNVDRQPSIPGKNFGCVSPDGSVFTVELATEIYPNTLLSDDPEGYLEAAAKRPTIVFGKFKFQRSHGVRLEWLNVARSYSLDITAISHDYSGRYVLAKSNFVPHPRAQSRYYGRLSGDSVSLMFKGAFVITDLSLTVGDSGKKSMPTNEGIYQVVIDQVPVVIDGVPVTGSWR